MLKEKKWQHHLLYADVMHFFLTKKCKKIQVLILNEEISISSAQLEGLQWNFHKQQAFTLSLEYKTLERVTTSVKI